jgi:hypothetical protein
MALKFDVRRGRHRSYFRKLVFAKDVTQPSDKQRNQNKRDDSGQQDVLWGGFHGILLMGDPFQKIASQTELFLILVQAAFGSKAYN